MALSSCALHTSANRGDGIRRTTTERRPSGTPSRGLNRPIHGLAARRLVLVVLFLDAGVTRAHHPPSCRPEARLGPALFSLSSLSRRSHWEWSCLPSTSRLAQQPPPKRPATRPQSAIRPLTQEEKDALNAKYGKIEVTQEEKDALNAKYGKIEKPKAEDLKAVAGAGCHPQ